MVTDNSRPPTKSANKNYCMGTNTIADDKDIGTGIT
jgi:hypothetical protein